MEVLWAPWRMTYIDRKTAPGTGPCIFCAATTGDPRERLLLAATGTSVVMLNRYPYTNGHLMVAPRRHTASLVDLPAAEYAELTDTLRRALATLAGAWRPEGFNVGLNLGACAGAGIADHLHWHIVPRWTGDVNFMPLLAEVHVMPQHLLDAWDRLRPAFAALGGAG